MFFFLAAVWYRSFPISDMHLRSNQWWSHRLVTLSLFALVYGLNVSPVRAHDGLAEQISAVTIQIKANPESPDLLVRRAELHRESRHWSDAFADLDRAAALAPGLPTIDLVRAHALLDAGRPADAIAPASRFLERQPHHADALTIRARAHAALKHTSEADRDFVRALEGRPLPELYIERSKMFASAGSHDLALLALDEGIARLGPVVTLELEAIDLAVRVKRYDEALLRIDRIASQTPRKETWLERRGDVLEKAGRLSEAREAYQAAFDALSLLPAWTQETQASTTFRARLRTDLARVNRRLASSAQDHQ